MVSAAVSVDGYLDDASPNRLLLSNDADFDRVDEVRAGCDAILVGAETVRRDNPRLLVRSAERRAAREARGAIGSPLRVVLTRSGRLDPAAAVFAPGAETVVYRGEALDVVLADLVRRGVGRLLVEGGGSVQAQFLTAGLVDELHLVVAPFFVGDPAAPRFAGPGTYPNGPDRRMRLVETRPIGDVVLLRYLLGSR
ncbi:5-amino-6-(5-phosphoribosylamino)uracil reductase [Cryptosporangium aurantiacum]|uniref:5-amino-6-(5-phosphoribosylamino)uracil reductase n=1 Tax=Cryptosporangium aurantiacum TaxID=134849 RepID=A0A1M7MNG0_9ACTN|nr:5-amino-6-(5-phosphoribosylamino)uracil reductase [Cryptosporangium aurantiacum]